MFVQEMTAEDCRKALAKDGFGRLACAHDNQPYIVPVHFAADGDFVYSFSMPGKKLEWMRNNPRVCLEVDSVHSWNDWTSSVVLGRYEELLDTPEWQSERARARDLLQRRIMWWYPGSVAVGSPGAGRDFTPVFFRISIEHVTGRRGVPAPGEAAATTIGKDKRADG